MTTPPVVADAPIPDDLLAQALLGATERSALREALPDEEPTAPSAAVPPVDADEPDAPDTDDTPDADDPEAQVVPDAPETLESGDSTTVDDPFTSLVKAGQPLTYTSAGQQRTFDGIVEIAGKGAVVPLDALPKLRDVLQRSEHDRAEAKRLYEQTQEFERLGGPQKLLELEQEKASLDAAGALLVALLDSPEDLASLLYRKEDGSYGINEQRRRFLIKEMQVSAKEATFAARDRIQQTQVERETERAQVTQRQQVLETAIAQLGANLTPEERAEALTFFGGFTDALYRKATIDDVQAHPGQFTVGQTILDVPKMMPWFAQRTAERERLQKAEEARKAASVENARRAPVQKPVVAKPQKPKAVPRNEDGTFAERKKYDRDDFLRAAMRGEPTPGTQDD